MARLLLVVRDFACHEQLVLDASAPVNLVVGANGTGKTTIIDAIEFALTGVCTLRGYRTKKAMGLGLIRDGAAECSVELTYDAVSVRRTMDRAGTQTLVFVEGHGSGGETTIEGKLTDVEASLANRLHLDPVRFRAALNARALLEGKEEDRRRVLFGAAGAEPTQEALVAAFASRGLTGEDVVAFAKTVLTNGWEVAEAKAVEARRQAKSRLADEKTPEDPRRLWQPTWAEKPIDLETVERAAIAKRIEQVRSTLEGQIAADSGALARAEEKLAGIGQALFDVGDEIAKLKPTEAAPIEVPPTAEAVENLRAFMAGIRALLARTEAAATPPPKIEPPAACSHLPGTTACVASKSALESYRKDLVAAAETAAARLPEIRADLNEAQRRHAELDAKATAAAAAAKNDAATAQRRIDLERKFSDLERQRVEARSAVEKIKAAGPATDDQKFTRERIERGEKTLAAFDKYANAKKALADAAARTLRETTLRDRADLLVRALAPSGIRSELVADVIGPFEAALNEVGKFLGTMRVSADLEIEMQIGAEWRSYVQLSESQRMRLELAVSHALASAALLPFLVFDRLDALDVESAGRGAALQALASLVERGPYVTALAFATPGRKTVSATPIAGVETWHLRADGSLQPVPAL